MFSPVLVPKRAISKQSTTTKTLFRSIEFLFYIFETRLPQNKSFTNFNNSINIENRHYICLNPLKNFQDNSRFAKQIKTILLRVFE